MDTKKRTPTPEVSDLRSNLSRVRRLPRVDLSGVPELRSRLRGGLGSPDREARSKEVLESKLRSARDGNVDELVRMVAALRRRVTVAERKLAALEKKLSAPIDLDSRSTQVKKKSPRVPAASIIPASLLTPDGLVMVSGVPHLVECMLVQQPLFGSRTCTCGSLGMREQRRS